jgi:hypothetical protein
MPDCRTAGVRSKAHRYGGGADASARFGDRLFSHRSMKWAFSDSGSRGAYAPPYRRHGTPPLVSENWRDQIWAEREQKPAPKLQRHRPKSGAVTPAVTAPKGRASPLGKWGHGTPSRGEAGRWPDQVSCDPDAQDVPYVTAQREKDSPSARLRTQPPRLATGPRAGARRGPTCRSRNLLRQAEPQPSA